MVQPISRKWYYTHIYIILLHTWYIVSFYWQFPRGIEHFFCSLENQIVLGGNIPIFSIKKIQKTWLSAWRSKIQSHVFRILIFLLKIESFLLRGIKTLFFNKLNKKTFTAWRTPCFVRCSCTYFQIIYISARDKNIFQNKYLHCFLLHD